MTRYRAVLALIGAAASLCLPGVAEGQTLRPLHKSNCELRGPLAGTAGHVLVRFTVNMAGTVTTADVDYATADPPDRKAALEESITECVKGWTFEPNPEPTSWGHATVELFIGFHFFHPPPEGGPTVELDDGHRVPVANVEEMRAAKLAYGAQLLQGPDDAQIQEGGWSLRTNIKKKDRQEFVDAIREGIAAFGQVFPEAPPAPADAGLTIMLFRSEDEFNRIAAFDNIFRGPQPAGTYDPLQRTAYTFASGGSYNHPLRLSVQYLVHEVTHHLVFERLAGGSRRAPYWVNEGIATFVGLLRPPVKGKVDPFRFMRGRQAQGAFRWTERSDTYLEMYAKRRKEGSLPDLARFLKGDFDAVDPDTSYGYAWILTHYFLTGDEGKRRDTFTGWMLGPMGTDGDAGLLGKLGLSAEELQNRLDAHVEAMRLRG